MPLNTAILSGSINNVTTTIVTTLEGNWSISIGNLIVIENEIVEVTDLPALHTLTVKRAQKGTVAASHTNGLNIYNISRQFTTDTQNNVLQIFALKAILQSLKLKYNKALTDFTIEDNYITLLRGVVDTANAGRLARASKAAKAIQKDLEDTGIISSQTQLLITDAANYTTAYNNQLAALNTELDVKIALEDLINLLNQQINDTSIQLQDLVDTTKAMMIDELFLGNLILSGVGYVKTFYNTLVANWLINSILAYNRIAPSDRNVITNKVVSNRNFNSPILGEIAAIA